MWINYKLELYWWYKTKIYLSASKRLKHIVIAEINRLYLAHIVLDLKGAAEINQSIQYMYTIHTT